MARIGSIALLTAWTTALTISCTTPTRTSAPVRDEAADVAPIEATSLRGAPLTRPRLPTDFQATQHRLLAEAEAALAAAPGDAESLIWVGRRLAYLGRYRDAVATFTRGIELHPEDARFLRHRGHRFITLRRLDDAIRDLTRGTVLVDGTPDIIEPDGLPNALGQPTSTLQTNLWYHLGLAHYLSGRYAPAHEAYSRCFTLATNPDMRAAAAYWQYLAARRLGRSDLAEAALTSVDPEAELIENHDYQALLAVFRGTGDAEALVAANEPDTLGGATVGYGVAAWHLVHGRVARAHDLLARVVRTDGWSAFGFIAAEAELARGSTQEAGVD